MGMRQVRKATIRDVAAHAGVSTATISYFVGGRHDVCSPETGLRIQAAVKELGYYPNSIGRSLRQKSTKTLGLCMLALSDPQAMPGSFFLERLSLGITTYADASDYSVLLYPASVRDGTSCDAFLDGRVDGLLFHPHDNIRTQKVAAAGLPTVLLTRSIALPDACGAVWADESQCMDLALSHLWDLGHRRIAHIAGPTNPGGVSFNRAADVAVQRLHAYNSWMMERDSFDPVLVGAADGWTGERVPNVMINLLNLKYPPTAVVCANDRLAIAAIAAANEAGISVPRDISVVGVDNSPETRGRRPALTSVHIPLEEIGREAVSTLLRLMHGAPVDECRIKLPVTRLVIRDSTTTPRKEA